MARYLAVFAMIGVMGGLLGAVYGQAPAAAALPDAGGHGAWYASRAAGLASYLFLWVGLFGGLMMSSAWFDGFIGRAKLLAIHQAGSIAGVLLGLAHALVLIPDGWTRFGPADLFIPFNSYYEPNLSAIGTLTLYLGAVVALSFWVRRWIGAKAWRWLHYASFLVFAGAFLHGIKIGTDSGQPWVLALYLGTTLSVIFSVVIRVTYRRPQVKRRVAEGAAPA